jgi:hypothetical protein
MTRNITSYFHPDGGCGRGRGKQQVQNISRFVGDMCGFFKSEGWIFILMGNANRFEQ